MLISLLMAILATGVPENIEEIGSKVVLFEEDSEEGVYEIVFDENEEDLSDEEVVAFVEE